MKSATADDISCRDITVTELCAAIKHMRTKGAAGPDDIPPTFLKSLDPFALSELLAIFNQSFQEGSCH